MNYSWGKKGGESLVGTLGIDGKHMDAIDGSQPYAELWMGTHQNGPSKNAETGKLLSDELSVEPSLHGAEETSELSYLFKVLSVAGPLSIQIHPTKEQAKILHSKDPKNYSDANHKPEIAIALTDFELLSGFRCHSEIAANLQGFPEILELFGNNEKAALSSLAESPSPSSLRVVFSKIWKTDSIEIGKIVERIYNRVKDDATDLHFIIARLAKLFPGDVGALAPIFLNYFKLKPGEATFLSPNMPHAYLFGDCVECMACSDNTIRAGLTPKFIDVESLVEMLNYSETLLPKYVPTILPNGSRLFTPPGVDEFWVQEVTLNVSEKFEFDYTDSSSILVVINGAASVSLGEKSLRLDKGQVVFVRPTSGSSERVYLENPSDAFLAYRAFTPMRKFLKLRDN
ncbi:unnamed protein product [Caenorhabditis auriculariae]|uniref:Mannose-6-phosphate isomerase n=1 Tax=Caenorhabditis auriculariae TaxID=2777116 RepID=A0A8S1GYL3_9PELO|nr:unnamed protein product [Caenorhabditis auriculariae]